MQKQLETLLANLIAFPTTSDNTAEHNKALAWISKELEADGLHVTHYDGPYPSIIATSTKTKHPKILLKAHLDVVPANDDLQYQMQIEEDRLLGRGVFDMKYAIACYLLLSRALKSQQNDLDYGIMITTDEEIGGFNGAEMLLNDGWRTDIAIIPDGGDDWCIEERAKGGYLFGLNAQGISAHGSRPWEGTNAAHNLLDALQIIRTKYPLTDKEGITATITMLNGGQAINQVPDEAKVWVDIRAYLKEDVTNIRLFISGLASEHDLQVTEAIFIDPLALEVNHPLVQAFQNSLEKVRQQPVGYCDSFAATDGRWFAKRNIPCVLVRPRGGGLHGPDEWIKREDLDPYYRILKDFVLNNA